MPTVHHDVIEGRGAALTRAAESRTSRDHRKNFFICEGVVRESGVGEHLPTEHTEGPDVTVEGEGGAFVRRHQQLRGHPPDGQQLRTVVIVIVIVEVVTYAEVGNFYSKVRGDKTVSCC